MGSLLLGVDIIYPEFSGLVQTIYFGAGGLYIYTLQGIPPWEKENHLQNAILGGYVSSLEGIYIYMTYMSHTIYSQVAK